MLIDRKSTNWAVVTVAMAVLATAVYFWDAPHHLRGPDGSTPLGLTLGGAALAIMLFCAGLGLKRRVPHWRLGRAQTWMRGHIWLGLLLCPLVALHAAFKVGGPLTLWIWILLAIVTVTGLLGLLIQQMLPSLLLHSVPGETVIQQIQRQIASLPDLAERMLKKLAAAPSAAPATSGASGSAAGGIEPLRSFYDQHAKAYLSGADDSLLANPTRRESLFAALRTATPLEIHPGITYLLELCDRRRQLLRQRILMRVLTVWLVVHVPLSWVLLVMSIAHAVIALRY